MTAREDAVAGLPVDVPTHVAFRRGARVGKEWTDGRNDGPGPRNKPAMTGVTGAPRLTTSPKHRADGPGVQPPEGALAAGERAAAGKTAQTEQRLHAMFQPVIEAMGLELVQVKLGSSGQGGRLQVAIDRVAGHGSVQLGDCAKVSRRLSALLDEHDPIAEAYDLEVSSPGINRILRHEADFRRFVGLTVKVTVDQESDGHGAAGKETVKGVLETVTNQTITLRLGKKLTRDIALADVQKASLDPTLKEWEALGKKLAVENAAYVQQHGTAEDDVADEGDEDDAADQDDAADEDDVADEGDEA